MQKVMSGTTFPSADKLEAIAAHFEIQPWELLVKYDEQSKMLISILQLLNSCPPEMLPIVKEVIVYLLGTLPKNK